MTGCGWDAKTSTKTILSLLEIVYSKVGHNLV